MKCEKKVLPQRSVHTCGIACFNHAKRGVCVHVNCTSSGSPIQVYLSTVYLHKYTLTVDLPMYFPQKWHDKCNLWIICFKYLTQICYHFFLMCKTKVIFIITTIIFKEFDWFLQHTSTCITYIVCLCSS
jgi:hypothetical protein